MFHLPAAPPVRRVLFCVFGLVGASLLLSPALSAAQVGSEWNSDEFGVPLVVADIAPEPGLEAIVPNSLGGLELRSFSTGTVLDLLPSPFGVVNATTFYPRDVDQDGLAELICVQGGMLGGGQVDRLGCLDYDRGLVRKWPEVENQDVGVNVEFIDLSASEPVAIARWGPFLRIHSSQDGSLLYDSEVAVGSDFGVLSVLVDDFDLDGQEEALVEFQDPLSGPGRRFDLVGDLGATAVAGGGTLTGVQLLQNQPNPMVGSTRIAYDLPERAKVRLRVFDTAGRRVRTLVDQRVGAGRHFTTWDGRDEEGSRVARGIYFYELDVGDAVTTRKLVRLR